MMGQLYCLDTSAFIEPWHRRYPIDVFPTFWDRLDGWANDGRVISPDEVFKEISYVADDLHEWVRQRQTIFQPPTMPVQDALREVLRVHPRLVGSGNGKHAADPWVIAQARVTGATVVTEEHFRTLANPKIPDVCRAMQVPCIDVLQLIRAMGLKL